MKSWNIIIKSIQKINNRETETMKPIFSKLLFFISHGKKVDTFNNAIEYHNTIITKKEIKTITPLYMQYRQSANLYPTVQEIKKYLNTERTRGDDYFIIAHESNRPVGFLHYTIERSTLRPAQRIRIKAVFVSKKYREQGIAKQLLKELKKCAGAREIVVKARRSNNKSCNMYNSDGFTEDMEYIHLTYRNK